MFKRTSDETVFYALRLKLRGDNGKPCFYVGKTTNLKKRIDDHRTGQSNIPWIDTHGGIAEVIEIDDKLSDLKTCEMKTTVQMMLKHGLDNVRGSEWTHDRALTEQELNAVRTFAFGTWDLCRTCGNKGHFANACNMKKADWMIDQEKTYGCERCGRDSHSYTQCYAKHDIDGHSLSDTSDEESEESEEECDEFEYSDESEYSDEYDYGTSYKKQRF